MSNQTNNDYPELNDGPEPLENLGLYLVQYEAWSINITVEDIMDDFGISREEAESRLAAEQEKIA